jgi:hypothetical protein
MCTKCLPYLHLTRQMISVYTSHRVTCTTSITYGLGGDRPVNKFMRSRALWGQRRQLAIFSTTRVTLVYHTPNTGRAHLGR